MACSANINKGCPANVAMQRTNLALHSSSSARKALKKGAGIDMQRKRHAGAFQDEATRRAFCALDLLASEYLMDTIPVTPSHPVELPPLSPPFISADDAAYWAHRRIRHTVEWEYGGVILQDKEGLFRATEPRHGEMPRFYFETVLSADKSGHPVAPKGFKVVAIYHSHQSVHEQMRSTGLSDSQVRFLLGSFTSVEMLFNIAMGESVPVHYLSGPDGSLIKYVASGNAVEQVLHDQLVQEWNGQAPQHYTFVHSFILDCAAAGELWVVVANDEWGGVRGRLTPTWVPGTAVTSKVEALPLCTRVYAQAEKAATVALDDKASAGPGVSGFILKCPQGYVATWPVPAAQPWFLPKALFPDQASGGVSLPEHCSVQGAYATVPAVQEVAPAVPQPWLYKVMFSASQLAAGIGQLRANTGVRNDDYPTSLYFQTSDHALLRYTLRGSQQETTLFVEGPQGVFKDDGSEDRMRTGVLSAHDYVLRVAGIGALEVLRTSEVWNEKAILTSGWKPYSNRQPPLSPAFVTADDAARYAHGQLDYRRLFNCAALILQRDDQRFVVTEPVSTNQPRFALDAVYPLDAQGEPIMLTAGCRLYALFCARIQPDAAQSLRDNEARVAAQMFMDTDIYTLLSNHKVVARAYLSGSVNSLLAYTSQALESYTERELLERVTPSAGSSTVARELSQGTLVPSAFVREQAYLGRLRVVLASPLWGPVGDLPEDWEPALGTDASRLPETPLLGPVFASVAEAVRDAHERTLERYGRSPVGLGVVLRHRTLAQYAVTQSVSAELLDQLLHTCRFAEPLQQAGFEVDSFYASTVRLPEDASASGRWLARHFIAPDDLHAALYDNVGVRRLPLSQRLVVHIATLEGAMLAYEAGTRDGVFGTDTKQGLSTLKRGLDSAEIATTDFVLRVAGSGQLHVILESECWSTPGQVDAHWVPFLRVLRRRLSPAFSCADDAARYALMRLGARRDKVYGGLILRSSAGLFVATEPLVVHVENFDVQWVRSNELVAKGVFLGGSTVVAFYHSCSAYEPQFPTTDTQWNVYRNMFSTAFVTQVLRERTRDATSSPRIDYLLCNDGALLRYRFDGGAKQLALAAELNLASAQGQWHRYNPIEEQIRDCTLQPEEWVNRLAYAGELVVLQGSELWGPSRIVTALRAYSQALEMIAGVAAQADAGLSPLFTQPLDVARYLHRLSPERDHLAFGFILKSSNQAHFAGTLPLPLRDAEGFKLNHVFVEGKLPQGFTVHGVYLHARVLPQAGDSSPAAHFFWPLDLLQGLAAAEYGRVPLYLSCADGALLMLDTTRPAAELATVEAASRYGGELHSAAVPLLHYIRKVAAGNKLRVLLGSPFWFETTWVTAQWVPYKATPVSPYHDYRLALSPIFLHSDDAARYTQHLVGPYKGDDYLGAILEDVLRRAYVAVEPLVDNDANAVPSAEERLFWKPSRVSTSDHNVPLPEYPDGHRIVMTHQLYKSDFAQSKSDPATSLGVNFISWSYIWRYTRGLRGYFDVQNYYLSTRDGGLLRYTPDFSVDSREETMVHQFKHLGAYEAREMLELMTPYRTLNVVRAGSFWTQKGLIEGAPSATALPEQAKQDDGFHREKDEF